MNRPPQGYSAQNGSETNSGYTSNLSASVVRNVPVVRKRRAAFPATVIAWSGSNTPKTSAPVTAATG